MGNSTLNTVLINGEEKRCKDLTLDEIKYLFISYKDKYGTFPSSVICLKEERDNLPSWSMIKKRFTENNMTLNDFLLYIGNTEALKPSLDKYDEYIRIFKEQCELQNKVLGYKDLFKNTFGLPEARWLVKNCPDKNVKTYNQFLEWLGYRPSDNVSKEKATELIYLMQSKLNRPLMYDDFRSPGFNEIGVGTINKIWSTMNKMKEELGLEIIQEDMYGKSKSKEQLLDDLQEFINDLGRLPVSKEFKENPKINSTSAYHRYFGGINNAFIQLGYSPNKKSISLHLTNEEIKEIYKDFIDENGFVPTFDYCKLIYSLPSPRTVLRRLECTWNDFIVMLGYTPNEQVTNNNVIYAKDGTVCFSTSELIIHNFLLKKNLKLNKEVLYTDFIENEDLHPLCKTKRCDWTFEYKGKLYIIEFFGLMGFKNYNERHDLKLEIIKLDNKINNFISIYGEDLKHLDSVFSFFE